MCGDKNSSPQDAHFFWNISFPIILAGTPATIVSAGTSIRTSALRQLLHCLQCNIGSNDFCASSNPYTIANFYRTGKRFKCGFIMSTISQYDVCGKGAVTPNLYWAIVPKMVVYANNGTLSNSYLSSITM